MKKAVLKAYEGIILDRPVVCLILVALVTAFFGLFIQRFELDISADSLVLENDVDLKYYRSIAARYSSDDFLIVTYTPESDLFSPGTLSHLESLRNDIAEIERVDSVITILDVPLLESPPVTMADLNELSERTLLHPDTDREAARRELVTSPLYGSHLVSRDGLSTALQINFQRDERYLSLRTQRNELREKQLDTELSPEDQLRLDQISAEFRDYSSVLMAQQEADIEQIRRLLKQYGDQAELHLGGVPMIVADMMSFIRHDLAVFGIAVLGIISILLLIAFRRPRWVLLPLLVASAATLVTVGFLGLVEWRITVVSSNFLALLLIFSLSLSVHLIVRYREVANDNPNADQRTLVRDTVRSKAAPCFYTVITTMVAFSSLVICDIRPVIDFGWIMVVALITVFALSFTLFPSLLVLLSPCRDLKESDITGSVTGAFARLADRKSNGVLVVSAALIVAGTIGLTRLSVENRFIDYFHESTEIYQGMLLIDEKFGGTTPLDVIVNAPVEALQDDEQTAVFEDDFMADLMDDELLDDSETGFTATSYWFNSFMLQEVDKHHAWLDRLDESGKVLSLSTTMSLMKTLNDGEMIDDFFMAVLYKRLPDEVKQQLIGPYLSEDGNQLRFAMRIYETDAGLKRTELLDNIRDYLTRDNKLNPEQVRLTGMVVLYNNLLQSLFRSQILTLAAVFAAILMTFVFVFRSLKVAAIAIIPNLIAAVLVLGLLGGLGIPLDIMTITIAAISVGIAVDDTIHYVHRYHEEWKQSGDYRGAITRAHGSIGRAMYYTTITITVGFAVLALSNFVPTIYFGLFTAFAMISALLADLALLPVLLARLRPYGERKTSSA